MLNAKSKTGTQVNLLGAAMDIVRSDIGDRLPGPHDDAEADLQRDRLIIAAREFVKAHEDEEPIGG